MSASTIEGYVKNGQIQLPASVHLPERAKVYVVIPDLEVSAGPIRILSPRLANPEQAAELRKVIVEETPHAAV
jgi:hypothetical protein